LFEHYQGHIMDWARAIERNSVALKGIVDALFARLGLAGAAAVERLPASTYYAVLRVLRPAESALRRLIVIAARGLVVKPVVSRPMPKVPIGKGTHARPSFQLFDPRKRFEDYDKPAPRVLPRIHVFGHDPRVVALWAAHPSAKSTPPREDGLVDARRLVRRLRALKAALDNLPRQALRLVRARIRRANVPSLRFKSPLRPGPPPGHRRKKSLEIDEILTECHGLAWDALKADTS
jgi:hypothetical protein